jgi:hypothetical protein
MTYYDWHDLMTWHIMADMICHKVYEFLMSILIVDNILM